MGEGEIVFLPQQPVTTCKQPVENVNTASNSTSQNNDEVVVAQVTPSPAKHHKVIPRGKNLIMTMPAECAIWPTITHSGLVVGTRITLMANRIATIGYTNSV